MAKRGGQRKLKRLAAPRSWKIERKEYTWIINPRPGPHPKELSIPLLVFLRDYLKLVKNAKEGKKLIKEGEVLVDKRLIRDHKFPIGIMDSVEIPKLGKYFRITVDKKGRIDYVEIEEKESFHKICKIIGKKTVKGGHIQLNLHDGRNILIKVKDPKNPVEDIYKVGDSLLIELPSQKIIAHLKRENGKIAFVFKGRHAGSLGRIVEIKERPGLRPQTLIRLQTNGKEIETIEQYVMVVGDDEPLIKITQ